MYTPQDIPAFTQLIINNASFLHRAEGPDMQFQVVTHLLHDKTYGASLILASTGKVIVTGATDPNPALAIFHLFNKTAESMTQALGVEKLEDDKKDHQQKKATSAAIA